MAVARLLLAISAFISVISRQFVYGGMVCEKLPLDICAFSVSSSGLRCVLENSISRDGHVQYECHTSEIIAENIKELIETDECMNACGVERMAVGMSTDSLVESGFTKKLCLPGCYNKCPNIIDLYFNLAAGEGVYLPHLCEAQTTGDRRMMREFGTLAAAAPASFALSPVSA